MPNEGKAHELYLQALELAAEGHVEEAAALGPLCHTCRIVKPLRSKHCNKLKRCVPVFDHHCPYVGTTLGAGNYRSFVFFMVSGRGCLIHSPRLPHPLAACPCSLTYWLVRQYCLD